MFSCASVAFMKMSPLNFNSCNVRYGSQAKHLLSKGIYVGQRRLARPKVG